MMSMLNKNTGAPPLSLVGAMPICDAICASRKRQEMTVRQVAEKVKATPRDVDAWERGDVLPPAPQFNRLCAIFPWLRAWVGEAGVQMIHGAAPDLEHVRKLPKYTCMLIAEMDRAQMSIQAKGGRKGEGLVAQSSLSEKRCEEILLGAPVSEAEHRRIVRALPRMKAHGRLLLEFVKDRPATPAPAKPLVIDVDPRSESVPPPREVTGPDAPVQVVIGVKDAVPIEEALGRDYGRHLVENYGGGKNSVVMIPLDPNYPVGVAAKVEEKEVAPGVTAPVVTVATDAPSKKDRPSAPTIKARTFGEYLRALREREGISQESFADLVGVAQTTLSAWERDDVRPVRENLDKIRELLPDIVSAPTIKSRDIPKPVGPGPGGGAPRVEHPEPEPEPERIELHGMLASGTYERVSSTPTDPMALVNFGLALGEFRVATSKGKLGDAVVKLLRAGDAAGLSVRAIADAVENRGKS